jgi:hypothetical protein
MSRVAGTRIAGWIAIAIPPITFYILLAHSLTKLPFADDYDSVLQYLLTWKLEHGFQHIVQIFTAQHNEYRLIFENAIFGIQYELLGHTNLEALSILGDLFVIPLVLVLYLIWRDSGHTGNYLLFGFVPASWVVFQLQYASTLNCAMNPLQSVPVILFMLLTCWLAVRPGGAAFAGCVVSLLLCISSSGNGLFMVPIGCLIFLQRKQYSRLAIWVAISAATCAIYFIGYNVRASSSDARHSVLSSVRHISLGYGAAFLGSIATKANPIPAIALSVLLLVIFIFATRSRLYEKNPALYYASSFFFVTGLAVSGIRSDRGLITALGSRYRINSAVVVVLLYFYLADKFREVRVRRPILITGICAAGILLAGFTYESDKGGENLLLLRRQKVRSAMLRWERHEPRPPVVAAGPDDFTVENDKKGLYEPNVPILVDAIQAGIYQLPDPLD